MKDRLAALQAARGSSGTDGDLGEASVAINIDSQSATASVRNGQATEVEQRGALNDFLNQCTAVQELISSMNKDVEKLRTKQNAILFTPDSDPQQAERQRNDADELSASIRKNAMQIRMKVKALEAQIRQEQSKTREKENPGDKKGADKYRPTSNGEACLEVDPSRQTAEMRIKVSQYSAVNHQFYDAYLKFNNSQRDYSEKCKDRLTKQIRILDPAANDEQVEMMLERGSNVFSGDLISETMEAKRQLADIEARHTEIINLERSIRELHDMFVDIEMFVSEQGEMIDRIETAVENAAVYVDHGNEELAKAVTYKKAACKKKICIIGIVSGVVIVIVIIIVISVVLTRR